MKEPKKIRPLFQNKAPLRPIKATKVQVRHQVDLVNKMSMPVTVDEVTYKYIVCNRHLQQVCFPATS